MCFIPCERDCAHVTLATALSFIGRNGVFSEPLCSRRSGPSFVAVVQILKIMTVIVMKMVSIVGCVCAYVCVSVLIY